MHPDATDSSGAGLNLAPAAAAGGRPASGAPGERRPDPREDAAAPGAPGGGSWRVPVAVAALAAVCLSWLGPGCWQATGGAGPCTVLLRLCLYLGCAAAAFLLGTLFSLVCRSGRAPPPDFVAAWRRLAGAARRGPGVSTGLPTASARPGPPPGPPRFRCPPPVSEPRVAGAPGLVLSAPAAGEEPGWGCLAPRTGTWEQSPGPRGRRTPGSSGLARCSPRCTLLGCVVAPQPPPGTTPVAE